MTLMPIMPRPNRARLTRSVRDTLGELVRLLSVVVISGRAQKVFDGGLGCIRCVTWDITDRLASRRTGT